MALWTPAEITTALWLDAADAGTITYAGSGAVSDWADKSGNGRHFAQATAGSRPTTGVDTINGLNVLSFDGDFMRSVDAASEWAFLHDATKFSLFAVVSPGLAADPNDVYGLMGTNRGTVTVKGMYVRYDDRSASGLSDSTVHLSCSGGGAGNINVAGVADDVLPAQQATLMSLVSDPALAAASRSAQWFSGIAASIDSSLTGTSTIPTGAPAHTLDIGSAGNGVWPFKGKICEFIIVEGAVDQATQDFLEGYLWWRWEPPDPLRAGHPYEFAAPTTGTTIEIQNLKHTHKIEAATLTQHHNISPNAVSQGHTVSATVVTGPEEVAPDNLGHTHTVDATTVTGPEQIAPNNLAQGQAIIAPSLTQAHQLAINALRQAHGLEASAVEGDLPLTAQKISQGQTAESVELLRKFALTVANLKQGQTVEATATDFTALLSPDQIVQSQTVEAPGVTGYTTLLVDNLSHSQMLQILDLGGIVIGSLLGEIVVYALINGEIKAYPLVGGDIETSPLLTGSVTTIH